MARLPSSLLAVAAVVSAAPAFAQERSVEVDVPASRLDQAIQTLSRQSGVSIGFRDSRLAGTRVRGVRGRYTPGEALVLMLRKTEAQARRVAPFTFLIEAAPKPLATPRIVRSAPQPRLTSEPPADAPPEEIVVTGTKRDIPLGAYPGGVQIIDGNNLSMAEGARGTDAIVNRVASVASTHLGPGRNKLFIRGIADSSFIGPTQATVGQYWGNSRITYSAPDPSLRLYDIGRIEVLEGPQSTLYGAGSLGGVVRVVPRAPDLYNFGAGAWSGVQVVQHGDRGLDGGGLINLPIDEGRLGLRAVVFGSDEGGYIDDTERHLSDVNKVKVYGGRAGLRFAPTDDLVFDINGVAQRIDGADSQYAERGAGLSRSSSIAQPYRNDFWLTDFVASKRWDDLELTASVGYAGQLVTEQFDGVGVTATGRLVLISAPRDDFVLNDNGELVLSPTAVAATATLMQSNRIRMITAETRLAKHGPNGTGWLVGISLLKNTAEVRRLRRRLGNSVIDAALVGTTNRVNEGTIYGEGTAELFHGFNLTLGGRVTRSRLFGQTEDVVTVDGPGSQASRTEVRVLPSAAIAYRPTDRLTIFGRFQEGFRPGGISARRNAIQRFRGDRVMTFEAGLRYGSPVFDVTLNASLTNWNNIQADLIDGFGFPTTVNVGDGQILSFGVSSRWRPVRGLQFDAAVYVNTSKVTDSITELPELPIVDNESREINFTQMPNIADVTGRVGVSYVTRIGDDIDLAANGFAQYVGKSTLGVGPILNQLQGNYLDSGLELRLNHGNRGVSLSLTNLLDARGNRFALGSPFLLRDRNQITPMQPRTLRLGFDVAF
jgi:iron complex outermembrane receptor protein